MSRPRTPLVHQVQARCRRLVGTAARRVTSRLAPAIISSTNPLSDRELPTERIVVVTHHKTGTVWLGSIFRRIARDLHLSLDRGTATASAASTADVFLLDRTAGLDIAILPPGRGVHLIRDPRDVVVSGCNYHKWATEQWLHEPRDHLGGETYQAQLRALSSPEEQLLFELAHVGGRTIEEMAAWNYDDPRFIEVKYEDLAVDVDLKLFHEIFSFLGFRGRALSVALRHAWEQSLFGGKALGGHVQSGETRQFESSFTPRVHAAFREQFPDVLDGLGYPR